MALIGRGDLALAAGLFVAAQVGYTLAMAVYDSLLVEVARPKHAGRVSGFGWAIGFAGGIAALSVAIALMRGVPAAAQPAGLGMVFMIAGLLMALVAVPAVAALRNLLPRRNVAPSRAAASAPFAAVLGGRRPDAPLPNKGPARSRGSAAQRAPRPVSTTATVRAAISTSRASDWCCR